MQTGKAISGPGDTVGLTRTGAVLDEVVVSGTMFSRMVNQLPDNV